MCCRSVEKRAEEWVKAEVGFLLNVRITIPASLPSPGGLLSATRSLRLDPGRLHDRQEPHFLAVAECLDLGRRGRPGRCAKIGVPRFQRRIGERLDGERIYLRHKIGLHGGGRIMAVHEVISYPGSSSAMAGTSGSSGM